MMRKMNEMEMDKKRRGKRGSAEKKWRVGSRHALNTATLDGAPCLDATEKTEILPCSAGVALCGQNVTRHWLSVRTRLKSP